VRAKTEDNVAIDNIMKEEMRYTQIRGSDSRQEKTAENASAAICKGDRTKPNRKAKKNDKRE
jgi:hypothetical protein